MKMVEEKIGAHDCLVGKGEKFETVKIEYNGNLGVLFSLDAILSKNENSEFLKGIKEWKPELQSVLFASKLADSLLIYDGAKAHRSQAIDTIIKFDKVALYSYVRQYLGFINNNDSIINVVGFIEKEGCDYWQHSFFSPYIGSGYNGKVWQCKINLNRRNDSVCYME